MTISNLTDDAYPVGIIIKWVNLPHRHHRTWVMPTPYQAWAFFVKRGLNRVFSALTVTIETFNQKWRFPFSVTVSVASNTLQIKASHDLSRDLRLFHPASRPSPLDNRQLQLGSETGMKNKFIMPCVVASMPSLVWELLRMSQWRSNL